MTYNFDFKTTIYDTMDKFIKDNEQVMIKARKNCAKNGLTKEQVSAIFGYCYHNLKDNKKKLTSYRDYCEKEANKTKTKNNKKKSLTKTLQDIQRLETVKYYIKNKLGKTISILENPFTAENMF